MSTFDTRSRKFDGKVYKYTSLDSSLPRAREIATQFRDMGFNARITQEKSELGNTYYNIYTRRR